MTLATALLVGFIGISLVVLILLGLSLVAMGRIWALSEADNSPWEDEQTDADEERPLETQLSLITKYEQVKAR